MLRILINGVLGKMGRMLCEAAAATDDIRVVGGVDAFAAGRSEAFPLFETLREADVDADVLIDFSRPVALGDMLEYSAARGLPLVIATTGHSADDMALLNEYARRLPIFKSANMSLGANLLKSLAVKSAQALGATFDVEIVETHHNLKADSPSGTALALAEAVRDARQCGAFVMGRSGVDLRRAAGEIGIHAVRGGNVVGEHDVLFLGYDEEIELRHSARSRMIFALGALEAARYIAGPGRRPQLYTMEDLLLDKSAVTHVSADYGQAVLAVRVLRDGHPAARLFGELAAREINVDMISQTPPRQGEYDIAFTIPAERAAEAAEALEALGLRPAVDTGICKLTVEGMGMDRQVGIAARVFDLLLKNGADIQLITTSETKISLCVRSGDEECATRALRGAFGI